ncbi:MAG: hypothetical protein JO170_25990 [Verrucomicrobia bacterium]|nr:hypothetical protein [Verrucomicrobiota bacterium]
MQYEGLRINAFREADGNLNPGFVGSRAKSHWLCTISVEAFVPANARRLKRTSAARVIGSHSTVLASVRIRPTLCHGCGRAQSAGVVCLIDKGVVGFKEPPSGGVSKGRLIHCHKRDK